jgi:hypothetical protein
MTTRTFTFPVNAPPSSDVPAWFTAAAERTWIEIPGTSTATALAASNTDPQVIPPFHSTKAPFSAESGMAVDNDRLELISVLGGGHSQGYTNEGFACDLSQDTPGWTRLHDRTPWYGAVVETAVVASFNASLTEAAGSSTISVQGALSAAVGTYHPVLPPDGGARYCVRFTSGSQSGQVYVIAVDYEDAGVRKLTIAKPGGWALDATQTYLWSGGASGGGHVTAPPEAGTTFEVRLYYICNRAYLTNTYDRFTYHDGRPWSIHTVQHPWYANGRVWFGMQNSIGSGAGQSSLHVVSYKRDSLRGLPPLAWTAANIGPFEFHGAVGDPTNPNNEGMTFPTRPGSGDFAFCPEVLDPTTGLIWHWGGKNNTRYYWSVDTNTGREGKVKLYQSATTDTSLGEMWAVCIPDVLWPDGATSSLMVAAKEGTNQLRFLRFDKAGQTGDKPTPKSTTWPASWDAASTNVWAFQNSTTAGFGFGQDWGAVWHEPTQAIIVYLAEAAGGGFSLGRKVRYLKVPMSATRQIDFNATWTWAEIEMAGVEPLRSEGIGVFSRFNIVRMGADSYCLVYAARMTSPVYACKITGALP